MNVVALEEIKQQWLFAADSMPQLICLVDRDWCIVRANRTLERWGLGKVKEVRGAYLHDVLHKRCSDPGCEFRLLRQRSAAALARDGRSECDIWDPLLGRHFEIRIQMPVQENGAQADGFFAAVTFDDVTDSKASEDESRKEAQVLNLRVEHEEQKRVQAEKVRSQLLSILDQAPVLAAMADRSRSLLYLNPAGRALLGLEGEDALSGLTLLDCIAPQVQGRIAEEVLPAVERDGRWSGDSVLFSRNGREIRSDLTLIAYRDEHGCVEGYCLLGRDTNDWVRADEALQLTQNELWRLAAQHLSIQESERRRIAADLHDGLGQSLSLVKLSIEDAARSVRDGVPGKAVATLERLAPTVKSALAELRRMSMNLRPATLDDLGILATLTWYFREVEAACPNVVLERDISVVESDVAEPLKIAIFRIVQEAIGNALKHAKAGRIKVSLGNERDSIELLIEDTGVGFDLAAVAATHDFSHGLGLQSMKERAELSGASYEIHSAPGKGTSICVRWPSLAAFERKLAAMPQPVIDSVRRQTPSDQQMLDRMSVCIACMRTFGSQ
jgi:PAS domain S-box-containing protein